MTAYTSHLACFEAFRRKQLERQVPFSTDPEYLRRMARVHQYSALRCVGLAILGLAFMAAIVAIGSI